MICSQPLFIKHRPSPFHERVQQVISSWPHPKSSHFQLHHISDNEAIEILSNNKHGKYTLNSKPHPSISEGNNQTLFDDVCKKAQAGSHSSIRKSSETKYAFTVPLNTRNWSRFIKLLGSRMCATHRLIVIHPCAKYGKPMSNQKHLLAGHESAPTDRQTDIQTDRKKKWFLYTTWTSFAGGIITRCHFLGKRVHLTLLSKQLL